MKKLYVPEPIKCSQCLQADALSTHGGLCKACYYKDKPYKSLMEGQNAK